MKEGSIRDREVYQREKTLDHTGWNKVLPRLITPSDIDMSIDNDGNILLIDLSCRTFDWNEFPDGQHRLYRSLTIAGKGSVMSVLAKHVTPDGEDIDTLRNIVGFTVIYYADIDIMTIGNLHYKRYEGSNIWPLFVEQWFRNGQLL